MSNFAPPTIVLGIAALWSAGCASAVSSACPPLVEYPPALTERLALEIESMGDTMVTPEIITDYLVLREQVRACRQDGP